MRQTAWSSLATRHPTFLLILNLSGESAVSLQLLQPSSCTATYEHSKVVNAMTSPEPIQREEEGEDFKPKPHVHAFATQLSAVCSSAPMACNAACPTARSSLGFPDPTPMPPTSTPFFLMGKPP